MKKQTKRRSDRVLILATTVVLVMTFGALAWALRDSDKDAARYAERSLETSQELLRVRIAGLVHELEQGLRQEAAGSLELGGRPARERLMERWRPLLAQHWSLVQVAVSDEYGNETALFRKGDALLLRQTSEGSKNGPASISKVAWDGPASPAQDSLLGTADHDPRRQLWFSKALEDVRNEPVWNVFKTEKDSLARFQLSLLVRGREQGAPFHIVMFEADPKRSSWLDHKTASTQQIGKLLLNHEGQVLDMPDSRKDEDLRRALLASVSHWNSERPTSPFRVEVDERPFLALISPYALNGQMLHTAVVMDASHVAPFVHRERRNLFILGALLLLLGSLLGRLWWRSRVADAEVREQERRSRSQEQHLAKVLGEREVLNREVHHRVKNNLQVVSSLLNLQASGLEDGPVRDEFLRGKQRIDTIALVHHKLYALKDLRDVDLDLFITALATALSDMHTPQSRTVSFEVHTNQLSCDQDTAIGLGIILCELVSNSFKHAFPYAIGGHIDILVQSVEGDLHRLVVKDNGKGLAPGAQGGVGKLGLEIVEALSEQLDGSFHTRSNGGTTFEVLFRMRKGNGSV